MPNKTVPALPSASALSGTEPIETVQSGASVKTTAQAIANLAPSAAPAVLVESGSAKKISAMSAASSLAGTETVALVQGGATVKTTAQAIANLAPAAGMAIVQSADTNHPLVLADNGTYIQFTSGSAVTVVIPTNLSVAFPLNNTTILIEQYGGGTVTITAAGGVTLHSPGGLVDTNTQYAVVSLVKVASDTWTLMGNLA